MTPPRDDRRSLTRVPGSRWGFLVIGLVAGFLAARALSRHDASLAAAPTPAPPSISAAPASTAAAAPATAPTAAAPAPPALRPELAAIRSRVLEECETHGFSSSSYPHATDLVEMRKFLSMKECSAEDAKAIVASMDKEGATVFFMGLADLGDDGVPK